MEAYARVYGIFFTPMLMEDYWPPYEGPILLPNPHCKRVARKGRLEHSRIRNEMDESRQKQTFKCSLCNVAGHNRRRCPNRIG